MRSNRLSRRYSIVLGATALGALVLAGFLLSPAVLAKQAVAPAPLVLTAFSIPLQTLDAVPAGGTPSNIDFTITSNGGPFCLAGFLVDPAPAALMPGTVLFHLERIDGSGVSHPYLTLIDGATGGQAPQDVVISYGSQLCASGSLTFHATQFAPSSGSGAVVHLFGNAIVLAASDVVVTAS